MADESFRTHPPDSTTNLLPSTAEKTQAPQQPESFSQLPLASLAIDLHSDAVTVVQKDAPLGHPSPGEHVTAEHVIVTAGAVETDAAAPASHQLAAALAVPKEAELLEIESKQVIEPETEKITEKKRAPESFASFKEESNKISDLSNSELKAWEEFKSLVQEAHDKGLFRPTPGNIPEEVSIWGVPLLKDERSDVILLKFLRARDFKVRESFAMLKNTIKWRREFNVDEFLREDLGDDLEKVVFMHGHDKEGHPVCYNVYGEFQNKELYAKTFSDEEKRTRFLRWRIQFLERRIRKLDFSPGGINTIFQVSDLKNSPGPGKKELRIATKQALQVLQDNYPEFVAKQVFINVPWWYLAFYTMMSPFLTQRTKSKFVFAGPSRTAETLFKYISPEQVPTQYGGLSVDFCECKPEFAVNDAATEITIKPATKQTVEIIVKEKCTLVWELRVVGWEVSYSVEFVPNAERGYTVIIQKTRKMLPVDEPVVSGSFDVTELGKILLIINNPTSKKKKLLYRLKVTPLSDDKSSVY